MSFGKRITLKDVGIEAGVSISTVSLALRNDSRLPQKTIDKVQHVAAELGYSPDPWLASLSSYRKSEIPGERNTTIAVLANWSTKDGWRENATINKYFKGAKRMAEQLGYKIEEFWIKENGGEGRTQSILFNRGIKGVLMLPLPPDVYEMDFDFSKFSVVQVGRTLHWPIVNTVTHNHYGGMQFTGYFLRNMGYRRIGLAIPAKENKLHRSTWLASFLAKQHDFPSNMVKIPVHKPEKLQKGPFLKWLKENRCDVVISNDPALYDYMLEAGINVPEEVGFSCLCMEDAEDMSGIHMKSEIVGSHAISLLHMLMMSGQRGCPEDPMTQLIEGAWHLGKTLKMKNHNIHALA